MASKSRWRRWVKPLASIRLAVVIILAMGTMSAWGTIVESIYNDARRAQETVYHSWYSYLIFMALAINLIAVMVDRLPWKKRHVGFIAAHIGILILIAGAILTRYTGVDATMALRMQESRNRLLSSETDLIVYSGLMTGGFRPVYEREAHFLKNPPSKDKPLEIQIGNDRITLDGFQPYSIPQNKIQASDKKGDGPALRFQMANDRVSEADWLLLGTQGFVVKEMGPAKIVLAAKGRYEYVGGNLLLLETDGKEESLSYKVYTDSRGGMTSSGVVKPGESLETGWMGLTFRLLKFLPSAQEVWSYEPLETSTEQTIQSVRFQFQDQEYWTGLNSPVKLFTDDAYYIFMYANRNLNIDFAIRLDDFRIGRYQGTRRAATYESDVTVLEGEREVLKTTISMNEPLKYKGYTFYQASFKEDETGRPFISVLSVNRDPGRPWKYLGSLLIVFGIFHLFYFKSKRGS